MSVVSEMTYLKGVVADLCFPVETEACTMRHESGEHVRVPHATKEGLMLDILVEASPAEGMSVQNLLPDLHDAVSFQEPPADLFRPGRCKDGMRVLLLFASQVGMNIEDLTGDPATELGPFLMAMREKDCWLHGIQAFGALLFASQGNLVRACWGPDIGVFFLFFLLTFCLFRWQNLRVHDEVGRLARNLKHFLNTCWNKGHKCKPKNAILLPQQHMTTLILAGCVFSRFLLNI